MTKAQFRKKSKELKREVNKLIDERIEKVINGGCVELKDYENNYILPKIFIHAVADEIKFQFKPLYKEHYKISKNMTYFL